MAKNTRITMIYNIVKICCKYNMINIKKPVRVFCMPVSIFYGLQREVLVELFGILQY